MPAHHVDCIITAAGLSSRMGKWKLMLPWQQGTVLDASIKNARLFCSRVILVGGYRYEELYQRYQRWPGVIIIRNNDYANGLQTSVHLAAQHVSTPFCFITHGDLPCLPDAIWPLLWQQRGQQALLPDYLGTPGHPILLSRQLLLQAVSRPEPTIRKALLAGPHRHVAVTFPGIIADVDTPEDYRRLYASHGINLSF